ncbi:MAG: SAM-dependent methyltransferase, partial [Desulfobacterales bacterium]
QRAIDLIVHMRTFKLEPKRLRWIHPKKDSEAILAVVKGIKYGNPGLEVDSPLIIYESEGRYSDEAKKAMGK